MEKKKSGKIINFNLSKHKGVVIVISSLVALAAFQGLLMINKAASKEKTVPIIIAKTEISKDEGIKQYEVVQEKPKDGIEYLNIDEIKSVVASSKIYKGDPITKSKVKEKSEDVAKEKVLYSLKLDPSDAVAGTLRSGNKVNIIEAVDKSDMSNYLFEEAANIPKSINIKEVFDSNSMPINDTSTPASTLLLELSQEEATKLRAAELSKKLKIVLANNE